LDRPHALVPEGYGRVPVLAYPSKGLLLHHRKRSDSMAMFQSYNTVSIYIQQHGVPRAGSGSEMMNEPSPTHLSLCPSSRAWQDARRGRTTAPWSWSWSCPGLATDRMQLGDDPRSRGLLVSYVSSAETYHGSTSCSPSRVCASKDGAAISIDSDRSNCN
jgi:hypothetical protein